MVSIRPKLGEHVQVWPAPGRSRVQDGPRPVDSMGGGRYLPAQGRWVVWDEFREDQHRQGELLLHDPGERQPK